jgi:CheY-like chemotaxis protein
MNLAINARDAMPGGGTLSIETSFEIVADDFAAICISVPPGRYVVLTVTDTGVGMTPEVQARIFEPFFTTKGHHGTGLGLSTTYGIVKQSGGGITVQSTPGFGTSFRVCLPAADCAPQEPDQETLTVAPARGTETILVVEDEADVRKFIRQILEKQGYPTLDAAQGDEAVTIASRFPAQIHLLITEMVLPQMNGPEILSRIRHVQPDIRVLNMSGYSAEDLGQQIDIQKPFTAEELLTKVREILSSARTSESASL